MRVNRCSVCTHAQYPVVEAALQSGQTSANRVGATFGLSKDAIHRHVVGQHAVVAGKRPPLAVAPPPAAAPGAPAKGAGTAYDQMRAITDALARVDVTKLSPRDQLQHLDAYSKAVEKLGRMEPVSGRAEPELVGKLREKQEFIEDTARALEQFPEARAAVAAYRSARRRGDLPKEEA